MAVRVSKADFEEKVLNESLPVLVDFYCKKLAPVLGNAEDDYEDKVKVYKVNTNFDVELAEQYEVQSNPTLILFKDGQVKDRKVGAMKQADLNSWIEEQI
jgi:thioredoxin 1